MRIRAHVREELDRVASGNRGAIDLGEVAEAEAARRWRERRPRCFSCSARGRRRSRSSCARPKGRCSRAEPRALIAKGLGLLGIGVRAPGRGQPGRRSFRLGIQYAQEGVAAADIFRRLGEALMNDDRAGEAIGPLRRAVALGGDPQVLWPLLCARVLPSRSLRRGLCLDSRSAAAGAPEADLSDELRELEGALGAATASPGAPSWRAANTRPPRPPEQRPMNENWRTPSRGDPVLAD